MESMTEAVRVSIELEIPTGADTRLLIRTWTASNGREVVAVAPQHLDRGGEWRLNHSGLILAPAAARALGLALATMADTIEVTS